MKDQNKVLIVGAGMAGLSAAAYLAREGFDLLVLDKNDRCGGLVNTFAQDGFSFDAGPRAFVNSGIVQPMLRDLDIQGEYLPNRISIGIEDELFTVESMDSLADYQRVLEKLFPESRAEIEAILQQVRRLSDYTHVLSELDNPNFVDILSDKKYIFSELLPWLIKFLITLRKMRRYELPMEDFLEKYTDDQSLIDMLTQYFFRKTPTHFALGYFYVYLDYFYPRGGTRALPDLLKDKIIGSGGRIQLNTEVASIKPAERVVVDAAGVEYEYDYLIWAGDMKGLYRRIDLDGLSPDEIQNIEDQKERVLSARGAESVFILFLAIDRPPAYFQSRGGEHMFYSPQRTGLGEVNRSDRDELLDDFENKNKDEVIEWLGKFCDLNTYEVSIPALRDENLAPPGKTGLMISCLFDYRLFEKVAKTGWYQEFKEVLENRIVENFSRTIYPGLKEDVLFKFSSTPLTISKVSGSSEGAITGWSFETQIPVVHQLQDIPKSVLTPIPNVYQAGQWTYVPAGVPVAMLTGWHAAQRIIKDLS